MPEQPNDKDDERGDRASFDRRSGEVHGSGSGAGGSGNPHEDYDQDPKGGSGENRTASGSVEKPAP